MRPLLHLVVALATLSLALGFLLPPMPSSSSSTGHVTTRSPTTPLSTLKATPLDDDDGATPAIKKKKRKVPLPPELLEAQASSQDDAATPSPPPPPSSATAAPPTLEKQLEDRLQEDILRFRKKEVEKRIDEPEATGLSALAGKAGSALEKVLVADFFVVLGFLGWFLAGVFAKSALGDRSVLDSFNAVWTPLIQPALGILMAGTLGVGAINNVASRSQETEQKKR